MSQKAINLHGLIMNAVETDPCGVISSETIFEFEQIDTFVTAQYKGGKIRQGYLVGNLSVNKLDFRYCQIQVDGTLDSGSSQCDVLLSDGLVQINEYFSWESREGQGRNVIQEMR